MPEHARRLLIVWGVTALAVAGATINGYRSEGPDYLQFWVIGRAMPLASYSELHRQDVPVDRADSAIAKAVDAGQDHLYLTASPLLYAIVARLSLADFASSLRLFQLVSLASFVAALILMLRAWGYRSGHVPLLVAACCLLSAPLADDAAHGNVSRVCVAMAALVMWAFRRRSFIARTAGAQMVLAIVVLFKPLAALAFPALLVLRLSSGRWTHAAYETGGFIAGTVLGVWLPSLLVAAPQRLWQDFVAIQLGYLEGGDYAAPGFGDASLVEPTAATLHLSVLQLIALAMMCCSAAALLLARPAADAGRRLPDAEADVDAADLALWLGAGCMLLISPLVWPHYYLMSIVLSLRLLRKRVPRSIGAGWMRGLARAGAVVLLAGYPSTLILDATRLGDPATTAALVHRELVVGNLLVCGAGAYEYARLFRGKPTRREGADYAL